MILIPKMNKLIYIDENDQNIYVLAAGQKSLLLKQGKDCQPHDPEELLQGKYWICPPVQTLTVIKCVIFCQCSSQRDPWYLQPLADWGFGGTLTMYMPDNGKLWFSLKTCLEQFYLESC